MLGESSDFIGPPGRWCGGGARAMGALRSAPAQSANPVFFIDGFAGPGRYRDGEPGSPLLAIDAAQNRQAMLTKSTVMFLFNESDEARFDMLEAQLGEVDKELPDNFKIYTDNKDFVNLAQKMVDDRGDRSLVPMAPKDRELYLSSLSV
jgi:three-Cys-motif partner protein